MFKITDWSAGSLKVAIAADHGGFAQKSELASYLEGKGFTVVDCGPFTLDAADDYSDFGSAAARSVMLGEVDAAVLICRSGVGMGINAKCRNIFSPAILLCQGKNTGGQSLATGCIGKGNAVNDSVRTGRNPVSLYDVIGRFSGKYNAQIAKGLGAIGNDKTNVFFHILFQAEAIGITVLPLVNALGF